MSATQSATLVMTHEEGAQQSLSLALLATDTMTTENSRLAVLRGGMKDNMED